MHVDLDVVGFECFHDIHYPRIADVRTVFFERESQHKHTGVNDVDASLGHEFNQPIDDMFTHTVVDSAPSQNDLRMVPDFLGLERQIVGVDTDTVTANETGLEGEEVPFGTRGLQYFVRIEAQFFKYER